MDDIFLFGGDSFFFKPSLELASLLLLPFGRLNQQLGKVAPKLWPSLLRKEEPLAISRTDRIKRFNFKCPLAYHTVVGIAAKELALNVHGGALPASTKEFNVHAQLLGYDKLPSGPEVIPVHCVCARKESKYAMLEDIQFNAKSIEFSKFLLRNGPPDPTISLTVDEASRAFLANQLHFTWLTKRCIETCNEGALVYIPRRNALWSAKITCGWHLLAMKPHLSALAPHTTYVILPEDELQSLPISFRCPNPSSRGRRRG